MALKKVKGNFERMFDKNLTDLVRGIRNNKENEVRYCRMIYFMCKKTVLVIFSGKVYSAVHGGYKTGTSAG